MNLRVRSEERVDLFGLVCREVVGDDVDLFALRLVHHDIGEERNKLCGRVPGRCLAQDLAGFGVEGCIRGCQNFCV